MARRGFKPNLGVALRAAGVSVRRCRLHGDLWPCVTCAKLFTKAEGQRARQHIAETRSLHQAWQERGR